MDLWAVLHTLGGLHYWDYNKGIINRQQGICAMKNLEMTAEDLQTYYFRLHHIVIFWK